VIYKCLLYPFRIQSESELALLKRAFFVHNPLWVCVFYKWRFKSN
jgi:hypothetical protein